MEEATAQKLTEEQKPHKYLFSFRARVYLVVTIIALFIGFVCFQMYSKYLASQLESCNNDSIVSLTSILSEQYLLNISHNGGKVIFPMLDKLEKSPSVERTYLTNSQGYTLYPPKPDTIHNKYSPRLQASTLVDTLGFFQVGRGKDRFIRSFVKLYNRPDCKKCHTDDGDILGYLFIDFSTKKIDENVRQTKYFGFVFTVILVFGLFFTVGGLHFRHIRGALLKFKNTFAAIEQGDLSERVQIKANDELGNLASHFNRTLDELEYSQEQIKEYHERELLNAQKLATVGEMAASFAHEIKNPLTGIVNSIEMLASSFEDVIEPTIIEEIRNQSLRVNRAINELLQFSKPINLYYKKGDINLLVRQVAQSLRVLSSDESVRIDVHVDGRLQEFYFDQTQMEKAITNVGINAVQAVHREGQVVISTRLDHEKNMVEIAIADDGPGIREADRERILKPFYTTKPQGTGLGLAITREIISKHGGQISFQNRRPRGVLFKITIPYSMHKE